MSTTDLQISPSRRALVAVVSVIAVMLGFTPTAFGQPSAAVSTVTARTASSSAHAQGVVGSGYWLATQNGGIFSAGSADTHGSAIGMTLAHPIVGIASTPTRDGYWMVASDGGVFSYGDAAFHGSAGAIVLNKPIVAMASTPSGRGYWMVASDGGIFAFGDAHFYGSTGAIALTKPIVGISSTPTGHGYWLVASDGGIFAFGDAYFHGSTGAIALNQPIAAIASTPSGHGYWMVAADGGVFSFGDAAFHGSTGNITLNQPIVGMVATPTSHGYWFVAADGGVFSFGDAQFFGAGNGGERAPVVGMAPSAPLIPLAPPVPPGPTATKLTFSTEPSAAATGGAAFAIQPVVKLTDANGATATDDTSSVTLAVTAAGQQAFVCQSNPKAAVAGVAAFAGCNIDVRSTYSLTATDGTLTGAVSTDVVVSTGPAARLSFTQEPSSATSLVNFATQPHVSLQDLGGNPVDDTSAITLSITTPAGAALTCSSANPLPAVAGVASFAGCHIDRSGNYTLHAVRATPGLRAATSSGISITAAAATHLAFTVQPSPTGSTGGIAFATQPKVTVRDASNNTVTTDASAVVLTLTTAAGATLACTGTTTKTVVQGIAAFVGCNVNLANTYTLVATDGALPTVTSNTLAITAGPGVAFAFAAQPGASTGGTAFGTQPQIVVRDAGGNATTGTGTATLTITTTTGAVLTCTTSNTRAITAGVTAAFTGCAIDLVGNYSLTASGTGGTVGGITGVSATFAITIGTADHLAFTTQPSASTGGIAFGTQPVVTVRDAGNNTVTGNASPVTLTITQPSNPVGAALTCTSANPLTATAGVATFVGCKIDLASTTTYTLRATVTGGATAASSNAFAITTGVAVRLAFTTQPSASTGGTAFGTQPAVAVQDAGGNTVVGNLSQVTLTITQPSNPVGAALTCIGGNPRTPVAGVASFTGCSINRASTTTYTLVATVTTGPTSATSAAFAVTVGAATQLAFTVQPSASTVHNVAFGQQPSLAVQDAGGNTVTTDNTGTVSLDLTRPANPVAAVLSCASNTVAVVAGIVTFAGCTVDLAGNYSLTATATTPVATVGSNALGIT